MQKHDLQFNRDTWEKFHALKSESVEKTSNVYTYLEKIDDIKFVLYLGSAAQMLQVDQTNSLYVGGLGINYKTQVVHFK